MSTIPATHDTARLTATGRARIHERVRRLREETIPRYVALICDSDRDSSVIALHEQATADLYSLEALLASALPAEAIPDDPDVVELGETVTITLDNGTTQHYVIVHTAEAVAADGDVSAGSPLGRALLGQHIGAEVEVDAPHPYRCVIQNVSRPTHTQERSDR
jgi:transcription elongation GreA/GreB family factor